MTLTDRLRRASWRLRATPSRRHSLVGPPHLWKAKRDFQIGFLRSQGLRPTDRLLDLGCGTLRGGIPLIEYLAPGNYTGVEVRGDVLAQGRQELVDSGLEHKRPRLVHADSLAGLTLGRFDCIWAFSVLIHMADDIAADCFEFVSRHLDGAFYANVNTGERPDGHWQGFPVVSRPYAFYESLARTNGLAVEDLGALANFGHVTGTSADRDPMLRFTSTSR